LRYIATAIPTAGAVFRAAPRGVLLSTQVDDLESFNAVDRFETAVAARGQI
jgi:hypothetical protein